MAFKSTNLAALRDANGDLRGFGGDRAPQNNSHIFGYRAPAGDTRATVEAAGYFNAAYQRSTKCPTPISPRA